MGFSKICCSFLFVVCKNRKNNLQELIFGIFFSKNFSAQD